MPAIRAAASERHRSETIGAVHIGIGVTNERGLRKGDEVAREIGAMAKGRDETTVRIEGISADPILQ